MAAKNSLETNIKRAMADLKNIKAAMINNGENVPTGTPTSEYATLIGDNTYLLTLSDGTQITAVAVDEETVFTATENDIRIGAVAATEKGVTTGTKEIPAYYVSEGFKIVTAGSKFELTNLAHLERYNFTKLQAIICDFNSNLSDSVSADKVSINGSVYEVQSVAPISSVVPNETDETIDFGITNETDQMKILRYFTYKEIY